MANNWNEKFLNNQVSQLGTRTIDDTTGQDKTMTDGDIKQIGGNNEIIDELNNRFGFTRGSILDKSFSEIDSKYVIFAGNALDMGFLLITTKVLDEILILTEMQTVSDIQESRMTPIPNIIDFENDLHGQIFLVTQEDESKEFALQILSNPFVTDDIDLRVLLLTKSIRFVPETFETIDGKDNVGQPMGNTFCSNSTQGKIAVDTSTGEYAEQVYISNYNDTPTPNEKIHELQNFIFEYPLIKDEEANLRSATNINFYNIDTYTPQLDIKAFNDKLFLTVNGATQNAIRETYEINAQQAYREGNEQYFTENQDRQGTNFRPSSTGDSGEASMRPAVSQGKQLEFNRSSPLVQPNLTGIKQYLDGLSSHNGYRLLSTDETLGFIFGSQYQRIRVDGTVVNYWLSARPYINGVTPEPFLEGETPWIDGPEYRYYQRRGMYRVNLVDNFLDENGNIAVDLDFKDNAGNEFPFPNQVVETLYLFMLRGDFDETCYIAPSQYEPIIGDGLGFRYDKRTNFTFPEGFTQTLFLSDGDLDILTTTFTVNRDGSIDITENNMIHQVAYAPSMINIPSLVNDTSMYIGYIQNQGYGQIDYLVGAYDEDGNVVDKSPIRSINPLPQVADSIYTYYVGNELIYRILTRADIRFGLIYLKDNDRISNINVNPPGGLLAPDLFTYFKDDNSIQIRSILHNNSFGAELSYTSQDENTIYFREEKNNQIDNFNLTRIGLLAEDFLLSDNNIMNKNMTQVSVFTTLGQEVLNYIETDSINLFNNNNVWILNSDFKFKKNEGEIDVLGFNIQINTPNNGRLFFDNPDRFRITKLRINEEEFVLTDSNFIQNNNQLKIGFNIAAITDVRKGMYFGMTGKIFKNKGEGES